METQDYEIKFIGGMFYDYILPPDKQYLFKYFHTKVQKDFLIYYIIFNNFQRFPQHTGNAISYRWCQGLRARYKFIENELAKANDDGDLDKIVEIKSGKLKIKNIYKKKGWNESDLENYFT